MRLRNIHIDDFGLYHQVEIPSIADGLSVFIGNNESGKTTLMEFLRFLLFGPPRSRSRSYYPPISGHKHSGRMVMATDKGQDFILERKSRNISLIDRNGAPVTANPTDFILGGLDRWMFEHIFAIGLDDLQGLEVLSKESLRGYLFAAGAGLPPTAIPKALQTIEKESGELLKPRGKNPTINQLLDKHKSNRRDIGNIQANAAEYAEVCQKIEKLESEIARLSEEYKQTELDLDRTWLLIRSIELWTEYSQALEKLRSLKKIDHFPADGPERLEELKSKIEKLRDELLPLEKEAANKENQVGFIAVDETIIARCRQIELLLKDEEKFSAALQDQPKVERELAAEKRNFERMLKYLGPDWNPEKLKKADISIQTTKWVEKMGREIQSAADNLKQAEVYYRQKKEEYQTAKKALDEITDEITNSPAPSITDRNEINERKKTAREILNNFSRAVRRADKINSNMIVVREKQAVVELMRHQADKGGRILPVRVALLTTLLALIAVIGFFLGDHYMWAAIIMVAAIAITLALSVLRKRQGRPGELSEQQTKIDLAESEIQNLKNEAVSLEREKSVLENTRNDLSKKLNIDPDNLPAAAEEFLIQMDTLSDQAAEFIRLTRERDKSEKRVHDLEDKLNRAEHDRQECHSHKEILHDRWAKWLKDNGYDKDITPSTFEHMISKIEAARQVNNEVLKYRQRLNEIAEYLDEIRGKISQEFENCGLKPPSETIETNDLTTLERELKEAQSAAEKRQKIKRELEKTRDSIDLVENHLKEKKDELKELLSRGGTDDEEEFRRRDEENSEIIRLEKLANEKRLELLTLAGNDEALKSVEEELNQTERARIEQRKKHLEERQERLKRTLDDKKEELPQFRLRAKQLARNEKLGELNLEKNVLETKLAEATRRWAALALTRQLLNEARSVYEREKQPEVMRLANRYLRIITDNRYRLVSRIDDNSVRLFDASDKPKDEPVWSSGLADQVYLAVRLGLAEEFSRNHHRLPVVLDDILVRFDPGRQLGAARVILRFAARHQVLLFSCRPEIRDIFAAAAREVEDEKAAVDVYLIDNGHIIKDGRPESTENPARPER